MMTVHALKELIDLAKALTPVYKTVREKLRRSVVTSQDIVTKDSLLGNRRLPGEVFAAEILTEPIRIEPSKGERPARVVIDRQNVEHAVITSSGKTKLCQDFINPRLDDLIALDKSIHAYLRKSICEPGEPLVLPPMPFRWCSGGIVSVVNIKGIRYVPMFFRDINPAGWNIPLGSSERLIDHEGQVLADFEHELNSPSLLILREFLEETLVLDRSPSHYGPKRFSFRMPHGLGWAQDQVARHLQDEHRRLRRLHDHIDIQDDNNLVLRPDDLPLPMDLTIIDGDHQPHERSKFMISINCLELGIEVIKAIEYPVPVETEPYFLDGEILGIDPSAPELVRMPIALFPVSLLKELFSGEVPLNYRGAAQASLEFDRQLHTEDVILFPWDIERRNKIIETPSKGVGSEPSRYEKWREVFGTSFANGGIPSLFTPATVKILNLLVSSGVVK